MKETDPAAAEASQGYPDKAVLNVTLDELKARLISNMRQARLPTPICGRPADDHEENHAIIAISERSIVLGAPDG